MRPLTFPDGFTLRRAAAADLPAYGAFLRRTFVATYGPHQAPDRMARHVADRFGDGQLTEELRDAARTLLLLERRGQVAGCVLLRAGAAPPAVQGSRPVEIERFYLDAEWHGRGLAAPLMAAALAAAREAGHDVAWLAVWERNPRAIRYYEKQGFAIVGRHVYLFDGLPEDDHLMARTLLDRGAQR